MQVKRESKLPFYVLFVTESIREFLCSKKPSPSSTELESTSPTPEKPPLSASVARRMIGHALGVRITASPEQKEKENRLWKEAKGMHFVCYRLFMSRIFCREKEAKKS